MHPEAAPSSGWRLSGCRRAHHDFAGGAHCDRQASSLMQLHSRQSQAGGLQAENTMLCSGASWVWMLALLPAH